MQKPVVFSFAYVSLLYINRCWQQPLQFDTCFACEWVNKMDLNYDLGDFGKGMNECGLQEGVHERCHDCRAASQKAVILKDAQWKEQNTGGPFKTFAMQDKAPGRYMWGSLGKVWLACNGESSLWSTPNIQLITFLYEGFKQVIRQDTSLVYSKLAEFIHCGMINITKID